MLQRLKERRAQQTTNFDNLIRYQSDPVGYAYDILQMTLPDDLQAALQSIIENRYTLVMAAHAVGKTVTMAVAANWWYDCWDDHICYITAPTWGQALGLTFKNVKLQRKAAKLPGEILESGWIRDPDNKEKHFIKAINAQSGEGFQGEHTAPVLIIIEEGVGVPGYIWDATKGLMTHADCRVATVGNPTDEATPFGEAASSPNFNTLKISVLDHPNIEAELHCEAPPFPGAVGLLWLYEMLKDECEVVGSKDGDAFEFYSLAAIEGALNGIPVDDADRCFYLPNATFQGRALGMFPTQADEQVIPRSWLESLPAMEITEKPEMGVDPARFGTDRTGICARFGSCLAVLKELRRLDTELIKGEVKAVAREVAALWNELHPFDPITETEVPIKIDVTGGLGAGPADGLRADGYFAIDVNSASQAAEPELYKNIRSELWFVTRNRAREKRLDLSRLPADLRQKLIKELSTPKYKNTGSGQKVVEDKDVTKKRLGASPDLADCCNLAFYGGVAWTIDDWRIG